MGRHSMTLSPNMHSMAIPSPCGFPRLITLLMQYGMTSLTPSYSKSTYLGRSVTSGLTRWMPQNLESSGVVSFTWTPVSHFAGRTAARRSRWSPTPSFTYFRHQLTVYFRTLTIMSALRHTTTLITNTTSHMTCCHLWASP